MQISAPSVPVGSAQGDLGRAPAQIRTCPGRPCLVPSRAPRVRRRRAIQLCSWAVFGMFSGSLVAIVTPMHADGGLDYSAWSRLVDFHLENGTSGIVVGGTTGESATVTDAELRELTTRACAQARGRIQIIAGAGTSSTATTAERVGWVSQ